ncbi:MAG: DUF1573 domain-containing protein [Cytophagales bacterium]
MKKVFALALILTVFQFAKAQKLEMEAEPKAEKGVPVLAFAEEAYDFGDINQGDKVTHVFKFKNEGSVPLLISNVQTTCGCTVPEWPKTPIPPGAESEIKATFNSSGKMGQQNKVITIHSNASEPVSRVMLKSNVLPKDAAQN